MASISLFILTHTVLFIDIYMQSQHYRPSRFHQPSNAVFNIKYEPQTKFIIPPQMELKNSHSNTNLPQNKIVKGIASYSQEQINTKMFLKSQMKFQFKQITTYESLLKQYDRILSFDLQDQILIKHKVFIMQIQMQPQNMFWINWKSSDEIQEFLEQFQEEINNMTSIEQRKLKNWQIIVQKHQILLKDWTAMNLDEKNRIYGAMSMDLINRFIQWTNLVGGHPYLRKTVDFLVFIDHCLPLDKWNMLVYQQLYIKKPLDIIDKMKDLFSQKTRKHKNLFFLTITSDGILKSDEHLFNSRIESMIPFTNLMKVKSQRQGDNIIYHIMSGTNQQLTINFHTDFVAAINFGCGLGRARIKASYKAPYPKNQEGLKLNNRLQIQQYQQKRLNDYLHRFKSFAPQRSGCSVKLYNDGCGYFQDMYKCLMNAQYQICITDWMLTPFFLLRRPGSIQNSENRLDKVLGQAAERGVKIFIILYMEPAMFVNNDSQGAAKNLEKLHKNIKVMRHPNVAVPIIWSHHEKLCVIDQKIGFMGGLDICYGRWDTPEHKLVQKTNQGNKKWWDGCDYNSFRAKDIYQPRQYSKSNLNQDFQVRMPWHDIALQMRGDSVVDLLRHFVQYWYFVKSEYKFSPRKFFSSIQHPQTNVSKRDIGKQIRETSQQFISTKWQFLKEDVAEQLFPGYEQRISQLLIQQRTGMNEGETDIQMLRSANSWSIGADPQDPQRSIHQAYKDLISNAESHIYIQNQFFMGIKNQIVSTLCQRIIKAWQQKKQFKVIIVVPLLPGFQGNPGDQSATVLRIQIHWQKVAIKSGDNSIYNTLKAQCPGINISDYLFFFGLRTHDILRGSPVTQIIYVHSKLMIVDDKRGICGSANINDRSLWGTGDSEIAVCIQQNFDFNTHRQLFDLRCRLYKEHFELTPQQCLEITKPHVWNLLIQRAKNNTLIYRQVFGCIPDDQVTTHQQIQFLQSQAKYNFERLKQIVGHAVEYPLNFMDDEDLQFSIGQKQYYAPVQSFT